MVAAIRLNNYIRELDLFSSKVGMNRGASLYEVASENELRWNLNKFLVEHTDHDVHPADGR
jgi:hypothetical protein